MIEMKDLHLLYSFINAMNEKGYGCEYKIISPHTTSYSSWDSETKTNIKTDIIEQKIEIKISKIVQRKS